MPSLSDFFLLPFSDWVNVLVREWIVPNFRPFFRALQVPVTMVLDWLDTFFNAVPMLAFTAVLAFVAWRLVGRGMALFTIGALVFIDLIGLWPETMTTLSMIVTSVLFCVVLGIPLGIAAARSNKLLAVIRPVLDIMQTIPSFVYLVPIVMLFGVGMAPGIIATIIFFNVFAPVYVLTASAQGAPAYDFKVVIGEIYQNAFVFYRMGYAGAQSVVLLAFVLCLVLVQFTLFRDKAAR